MELDILDQAVIWKEMVDFRSAVDSYVKQQADLSERERKFHLEFCQEQKSKIEATEAAKKKAEHDIAIISQEKEKYKQELERLKGDNSRFEMMQKSLPDRLVLACNKDEETQKKLTLKRAEYEKTERIYRSKMEEIGAIIELYKHNLGLDIHRGPNGNIQFTFTHINPKKPKEEYYFVLAVNGTQFSVVSSKPELPQSSEWLSRYNKASTPANFSLLIRLFRKGFRKLVDSDSLVDSTK